MIASGTGCRMQYIDFVPETQYAQKGKYDGFFKIDYLGRRNNDFMLRFFAKEFDQKQIVCSAACYQHPAFWKLIGRSNELVGNVFVQRSENIGRL